MNRRILIEELPDGRLVISTNFASGHPEPGMSAVKISTVFYDLGNDVRELLDSEADDAFQRGMRRLEWNQRVARRKERGEAEDDIPF